MIVNRNITISFYVFLTISLGVVSANPSAKSVYAQNNALTQNGGGNADLNREQAEASDIVNQIVSKANNILSGNNLQCQGQVNSEILDQICNSSVGVMLSSEEHLVLNLETLYRGLSFSVNVQPLNNLGKPLDSYSFILDHHRYVDYRYVTDGAAGLKITVTSLTNGFGIYGSGGIITNSDDTMNWKCSGFPVAISGSCERYNPHWTGDKSLILSQLYIHARERNI